MLSLLIGEMVSPSHLVQDGQGKRSLQIVESCLGLQREKLEKKIQEMWMTMNFRMHITRGSPTTDVGQGP
jgi:hypothetical protein